MKIAYLNNRFVPLNEARISILDRGFLYGDGVFETMRSYNGVVFHLDKHIKRLYSSLKVLNIRLKIRPSKVSEIVNMLLRLNRLHDAYIKIIVTRGSSKGLLIPSGNTSGSARPTLAIYALLYKTPSKDTYEKGIQALVSASKSNAKSFIAGHKTLNYLQNIMCRYEAAKMSFDDALFINENGYVSEATSSNIFLVRAGKIYTPCRKCGILPGITRGEVIRLARHRLRYKVVECAIKEHVLYRAEEAFFTNSLVEIMPVVKIDNHRIGNGKPGPVTKELMQLFKDSVLLRGDVSLLLRGDVSL